MQRELDVVIAGGSFAGLETMLALRAVAEERVSVELWAPDPEFLYRPLAAASPFGVSLVHRFPLGAIAERCGARYIRAALAAVDARARSVSEVALRFGFAQFGKFARDYRRLFGERPSETLRRKRALD